MIIAVLMWLYTNAVLTPQSRLALLNPGVERAYGTPNGAVDAVLMLDNKDDVESLCDILTKLANECACS